MRSRFCCRSSLATRVERVGARYMNQHNSSWESTTAREILTAQRPVDHPIITRCMSSSPELPSFAEGSPSLEGDNIKLFIDELRDDVGLMTLEPARRMFRRVSSSASYPI